MRRTNPSARETGGAVYYEASAKRNQPVVGFVGFQRGAIYGLSCRLQRTADGAGDLDRSNLYLAAARNASTSYEDLGLDFDGHTHAELYDDFAEALTGGDSWQLRKYRLPEVHRFSQWVHRNMVVEAIPDGLLTNMFSEIYNHGEYSIALPAVGAYFQQHTRLTEPERRKAITYIAAYVEDEVEAETLLPELKSAGKTVVVVSHDDRYFHAGNRVPQMDYSRLATLPPVRKKAPRRTRK